MLHANTALTILEETVTNFGLHPADLGQHIFIDGRTHSPGIANRESFNAVMPSDPYGALTRGNQICSINDRLAGGRHVNEPSYRIGIRYSVTIVVAWVPGAIMVEVHILVLTNEGHIRL